MKELMISTGAEKEGKGKPVKITPYGNQIIIIIL